MTGVFGYGVTGVRQLLNALRNQSARRQTAHRPSSACSVHGVQSEGFVLKTGVFMNHGQRHIVSSLKVRMKSAFP